MAREDLGEQGMDAGAIERLGERMRRSRAQEASVTREVDEKVVERQERIEREIERNQELDRGFGIEQGLPFMRSRRLTIRTLAADTRSVDSDSMPAFRALSFGDKWRVGGFLRRGEAPQDPQMAAAAVEWAESYQDQGQSRAALLRWLPLVVVVVCGTAAIFFAVEGDAPVAILNALIALVNLAHLALNPMVRPQQVARCLETSKGALRAKREWG